MNDELNLKDVPVNTHGLKEIIVSYANKTSKDSRRLELRFSEDMYRRLIDYDIKDTSKEYVYMIPAFEHNKIFIFPYGFLTLQERIKLKNFFYIRKPSLKKCNQYFFKIARTDAENFIPNKSYYVKPELDEFNKLRCLSITLKSNS